MIKIISDEISWGPFTVMKPSAMTWISTPIAKSAVAVERKAPPETIAPMAAAISDEIFEIFEE